MQWEVVIGLEAHTQLATRSKIFSGAATAFGAEPNTQASAVDLALPGVLPVLNRAAVDCAIRFGLAIGGTIAHSSVFARKNYFYPDLPKGYQISQYETPVVCGGQLTIVVPAGSGEARGGSMSPPPGRSQGGLASPSGGSGEARGGGMSPPPGRSQGGLASPSGGSGEARGGSNIPTIRTIRLTRAHLEEDAGKSLHEDFAGRSGIDLNRAGTPLLEIVSEPELRSAAEAVAYARTLHGLVTWLGICDGNMQEGSFRIDANVSVRPVGQKTFGTRCEIKNLNSFRFLERAIHYEVRRQIERIEEGEPVIQETRLYDPDEDVTRPMRSKEDAHDYRYFPDPDLPALVIEPAQIEAVRRAMPELPAAKRQRYMSDMGLGEYDAMALTATRDTADYFEAVAAALPLPTGQARPQAIKTAANWIIVELAAQLNRDGLEIAATKVCPAQLARLVERIADGTISGKIARDIFQTLWSAPAARGSEAAAPETRGAEAVDRIIDQQGLRQISDSTALEPVIDRILADNPKSVQEFRAGKEKAFNALVGQVMKASRGKANPQQVNELLRAKLG